jgi:hypothetical protein
MHWLIHAAYVLFCREYDLMLVPYSAIELGSEVVQWPPFLLASKVREISACE